MPEADRDRNAADVYRALAPAVLGYLRSIRTPDADDVLGEVFVHVARDIGRFRGDDAALRRWVFSIAHNRSVDARRQAARRLPTDELGPGRELAAPAVAGAFDPELLAALDGLTADQREVVVLRFVADLSVEVVARLTGRRRSAVKALQHRALINLSKAVSKPGD